MKDSTNFDSLHDILRDGVKSFLQENDVDTPILLFSRKLLAENIDYFRNRVFVDNLYFPVKTNNHPEILGLLKNAGLSFEIASLGELQLLQTLNMSCEDIMFGNPIKISHHINIAAQMGVKTFSVDTESELMKIRRYVKNADVYLRLAVSNTGAEWDLSEKFGCSIHNAVNLFKKALDLQLNPVGISFHVGWNNANIVTWKQAMEKSYQAIKQCHKANVTLKFINIGGGFPAHLVDQYDTLNRIAETINPYLSKIRTEFNMAVHAEPGSFLTANAGIVISKVIDVIKRNKKLWVYVDTGINQGFAWIMSGLEYAIFSPKKIQLPLTECVVCGPTCDSHDVFSQHTWLSSELKPDDFLLVYPAGAYIASSKTYNGFDYPITRVS